jgi:hypothetical protein
MVFVGPGGLFTMQKLQEFATADGFAGSLYKKGTAPSRANESIYLANEILGKKYMGAHGARGLHGVPS